MSLRTATLRAARLITPTVRLLEFEVDQPAPHVAGQWVSLKIPVGDEVIARSYSVASMCRDDGSFELAVTRVEGGPGSTALHAMAPGGTLQVGMPMGFFTLPAILDAPQLMVATGTGVAPMRAMLQGLDALGEAPPTTLLLGVRTTSDALFADEFRALARRRPWFRFELTLSRPAPDWTGRRGYVQTHLAELTAPLPACHVYVCGLNVMLKAVRAELKGSLGFTRERIHTERYD